jgi:hypothetical protein
MIRWIRRLLIGGSAVMLLQVGTCSLFDGQAAERILLGTVFDPLQQAVFDTFYDYGAM